MRIGIANDLRSATEVLRQVIAADPRHRVAWTAVDGAQAVLFSQQQPVDVILMDLLMPVMNGAEATQRIMRENPCPILVVTSSVSANFNYVCQAMGYGAYDAICLPTLEKGSIAEAGKELLQKLERAERLAKHLSAGGLATSGTLAARLNLASQREQPGSDSGTNGPKSIFHATRDFRSGARSANVAPPKSPSPDVPSVASLSSHSSFPPPAADKPEKNVGKSDHLRPTVIAIGSSTGGPQALKQVLAPIPKDFDASIVIVQHIGLEFVDSLIGWLRECTPLPVKAIRRGDRPTRGTVHVAATSDHLTLARDGSFLYTTQPIDYPYRPSVNALFYGLLSYWTPGVAMLLTGIGSDGAQGLLALKKAGWHTLTQDKQSSVVFGMPQAAAELGAADKILPLGEIGLYLVERVRRMRRPAS